MVTYVHHISVRTNNAAACSLAWFLRMSHRWMRVSRVYGSFTLIKRNSWRMLSGMIVNRLADSDRIAAWDAVNIIPQ